MKYIVVDLEATCWERQPPFPHETIEFGAVCCLADGTVESEFQSFVRPKLCTELSEFCTGLTGATQSDIDGAEEFPAVLERYNAWARTCGDVQFASWGAYDYKQLCEDAGRTGVTYPWPEHLNLKKAFAELAKTRPLGMAGALRHANLVLQGRHHSGIDDARNIARILGWMTARGFR